MTGLHSLFGRAMKYGAVAALLLAFSPDIATAQSVRGSGVIEYEHGAADGTNLFLQVAVNAYIDSNGAPQGTIAWTGWVFNQQLPQGNVGPGGPADPYIAEVLDITFDGNTAFVVGVVIASPAGSGNANGLIIGWSFTDNSGTGEPDELGGMPIEFGDYIVRD